MHASTQIHSEDRAHAPTQPPASTQTPHRAYAQSSDDAVMSLLLAEVANSNSRMSMSMATEQSPGIGIDVDVDIAGLYVCFLMRRAFYAWYNAWHHRQAHAHGHGR